ncbi:MAG TPA: carbohydrate porin [Candidatus Sulfotelmatobacter sp.]|nr:carbohydrate porin [Candidatus Sulfotelmatobacter sp.]
MTETVLGVTRGVFALWALLFLGATAVRAQQTAEGTGAPAASDSTALIGQQDVVSAFDDAIAAQNSQHSPGDPQPAAGDGDSGIPTMFPHFKNDRIWLSGQANVISQWHPAFHSPYSAKNSLSAEAQDATSRVLTLFTGLRLTSTTELLCDIQETGGHGVGEALGVAGFLNLDVVRNPTLGKAPYVARLMWHQMVPIGHARITNDQRGPYSLFREVPERRIEIRFGKMSLADFFDLNTYGTDSNLQFMNWTVDNNGAFDYAADTRGFTFAALVEYHHNRHVIVRFAEALMPKVANGIHLDADLARARAENIELELRRTTVRKQEGVLRLLTFVNHANMGDYRTVVDNFLAGLTPTPEITAHPLTTSIKYGFGANFEQPLSDWFGVFGRWGWNEGRHESYAYTEVDSTVEMGAWASGKRWGRKYDRVGLAYVSNGISRDHQEYLALGGLGFLLGDGRLTYGREDIVETFYTMHVWRGFYPALGFQYIDHPGYNKDRGPVVAPALRLHVEF